MGSDLHEVAQYFRGRRKARAPVSCIPVQDSSHNTHIHKSLIHNPPVSSLPGELVKDADSQNYLPPTDSIRIIMVASQASLVLNSYNSFYLIRISWGDTLLGKQCSGQFQSPTANPSLPSSTSLPRGQTGVLSLPQYPYPDEHQALPVQPTKCLSNVFPHLSIATVLPSAQNAIFFLPLFTFQNLTEP